MNQNKNLTNKKKILLSINFTYLFCTCSTLPLSPLAPLSPTTGVFCASTKETREVAECFYTGGAGGLLRGQDDFFFLFDIYLSLNM